MSWLYNRSFKIGAGLAVAAFVVANVASYVAASRRTAELELRYVQFSGFSSLVWGWPFPWVDWVAAVNLAVLLFGALFFGLFFRLIVTLVK